jgi:hypothetical protein
MRYSHNQVMVDNYLFDSEQEADYYRLLKLKVANKEIFNLKVHPEYVLIEPFIYGGRQIKATVYTPDFSYQSRPDNAPCLIITTAIEVKGFPTPDFELRAKLFKSKYPNVRLVIMQFSKATGWLERTEYLKARKKVNAALAVDRYEKKKDIYDLKRQKLAESLNEVTVRAHACKQGSPAQLKLLDRRKRIEAKIYLLDSKWSMEKAK